jgi:hypothetical protein
MADADVGGISEYRERFVRNVRYFGAWFAIVCITMIDL